MIPQMLLAYDSSGTIVAFLDQMIARDPDGHVLGLIDFAAHEDAGGKLRDIWDVQTATGSGTWPEWIGPRAFDFKAELTGKRITALVHRTTGHRRERAIIEAAIQAEPIIESPRGDRVKDIRHIVGGPTRPLILDDSGRTVAVRRSGTAAHLPVSRVSR